MVVCAGGLPYYPPPDPLENLCRIHPSKPHHIAQNSGSIRCRYQGTLEINTKLCFHIRRKLVIAPMIRGLKIWPYSCKAIVLWTGNRGLDTCTIVVEHGSKDHDHEMMERNASRLRMGSYGWDTRVSPGCCLFSVASTGVAHCSSQSKLGSRFNSDLDLEDCCSRLEAYGVITR